MTFSFHALGQYMDVFGHFIVDIGLVPGSERGDAFHDRMSGILNDHLELSGAVGLELSAHQVDIGGGVLEAPGGTVYGNESFS